MQQVKEMVTQLVVCWTIILSTIVKLLYYSAIQNYYKMIVIDLIKQQALDADPKAIQQINFTGNLAQQAAIFFIIEEAKETVLDFSQGIVKVF